MTREEAFLETFDCSHQVSLIFSICMSNDEPTGLDQTEWQSLFLATHWSVVLKAGCSVTAPGQAAQQSQSEPRKPIMENWQRGGFKALGVVIYLPTATAALDENPAPCIQIPATASQT
jgi:hypothetical protein